ncbi:MAG: arginine repressor [Eubacteriales bacterium]|nr:arginine repressor [Clostridiales bacterium]
MKFQRQNLILKLIEDEPIETQKDLSDKLRAAGFDVTQATVSRDIKELRIVKVLDQSGKYRYSAATGDVVGDTTSRFRNIFRESVVNVDYAGNLLVIKTLPGVANASAIAVEAMNMNHVVGSLAGDDTIFFVIRDQERAAQLCEEIKKMLK